MVRIADGQRWGGWSFRAQSGELEHERTHYRWRIGDCASAEDVLERIAIVSEQRWCGAAELAALLAALDQVFGLKRLVADPAHLTATPSFPWLGGSPRPPLPPRA